MPLIMTLRIILIAAALPTSGLTTLSVISISRSSGAISSACGPAIKSGVGWHFGEIGAITATST